MSATLAERLEAAERENASLRSMSDAHKSHAQSAIENSASLARLLSMAEDRADAAERRVAELEAALHSSKIALIDCLCLVASHKFSPEDYEDTQQRIDASGSRFSYFADAVEQIDIALSAASNNGWREMDSAPRDGIEILGFWSYLYAGDKTPTCGMYIISWWSSPDGNGWCNESGLASIHGFTHWQPLPPAPQVQS